MLNGPRRGATSAMASLLMVGLVLVTVGVAGYYVLPVADVLSEPAPQVSVSTAVSDTELRFRLEAGESIPADELNLVVETDDSRKRVPLADGTLSGTDGVLSAGDYWQYCQRSTAGEDVTMQLVHDPSNSVLATIERSADETAKDGLVYECDSAGYRYGSQPGYVTFNVTNYGDTDYTVEGVTITNDAGASRLNGTASYTELYLDPDGDASYSFSGDDGYASQSGGAFDVGDTPALIDLTAPGWQQRPATIEPGDTTLVTLFRFRDASDDPVNMRGATVTVTLHFADGSTKQLSFVVPTEEFSSDLRAASMRGHTPRASVAPPLGR